MSLNQLGKFISVDTKVDLELPQYFSSEELQTVLGYDTENDFLMIMIFIIIILKSTGNVIAKVMNQLKMLNLICKHYHLMSLL